ncbi:hypothetical protein CPB84DRAFT_1820560 [Gymnopilus junonius]|uniref:Uncharacterized protein n=1 Tax=Gymnopilus junonius TaxID=109634 RepID=A0A9P5TTF0_GYMJU|nr:hypothetical protein CPB84DRAFT_1820560 [Gymnopilus junonius]
MSGSDKIFNVEEVSGKDRVALETTAAEARIEAPNPVIAHEVDVYAEEAQEAAHQAAAHAKVIGPSLTGEPTTAAAPFRGNKAAGTAATTGYVEQAKQLANSAIETAQSYVPSSIGGKPVGEIAAAVQGTATGAYTTVKETAQPHLEKVVNAAQEYVGVGMQGKDVGKQGGDLGVQAKDLSDRAPHSATTVPLESGPHTVDTPYPASSVAPKIANTDQTAKESRPLSHN